MRDVFSWGRPHIESPSREHTGHLWRVLTLPAAAGLVAFIAAVSVAPVGDAVAAHASATRGLQCNTHTCVVPMATPGLTLNAVSCATATRCTAVGSEGAGNGLLPVTATETSGVWTAKIIPMSIASTDIFSDVSCPRTTSCTAVGFGGFVAPDYFANYVIGIESAGTWSVINGPQPFGGEGFTAVSCYSATDCTAVGSESFDGLDVNIPIYSTETAGYWTEPSFIPISYNFEGFLNSLSCLTATDCTAVGQTAARMAEVVTDEDGSWVASILVAPSSSSTAQTIFNKVSCTSALDCTAVGEFYSDAASGETPMYATETDGVWGPATLLTAPEATGEFDGVSCTSAMNCTAVGATQSATDTNSEPMYAVETSGVWGTPRELFSPVTGGDLVGVSCATAEECTAVGNSGGGYLIYVTEKAGVWPAVPGAPRKVRTSVGSTTVKISWRLPATNGGARITVYTATAMVGIHTFTCATTNTRCTIRGLTNGTKYAVSVSSRSPAGSSAPSATTFVTPHA